MERSNYTMTLDVRQSHGSCCLDMKQTDTHRRLTVRLTDGGEPYRITEDCFAVFTAKKPDGTVIYNECTLADGKVIYDITPQTTAAPGLLNCEIRLMAAEGKLLTSAAFGIQIHPTVYNENDTLASETEVSALSAAVAEAKQTALDLRAARDAGEFDGTDVHHSWSGTTLQITSAAGTSSVDLRGPQGEKGDKGEQGEKGDRGETAITDTTVGGDCWSSRNIVERLCPPLSLRGKLLSFVPMAGYPLTVTTREAAYVRVCLCGKNLYNKAVYPLNTEGYVNRANGKFSTSNTYRRTDYIPAAHLAGQRITLNFAPVDATNPGMAFYDAQKNYISGGAGNDILVPATAVYMIFSVAVGNATKDIQLELGSIATDYEPYWFREEEGEEITLIGGTGYHTLYAQGEDGIFEAVVSGRADPVFLIQQLTRAVTALGGSV